MKGICLAGDVTGWTSSDCSLVDSTSLVCWPMTTSFDVKRAKIKMTHDKDDTWNVGTIFHWNVKQLSWRLSNVGTHKKGIGQKRLRLSEMLLRQVVRRNCQVLLDAVVVVSKMSVCSFVYAAALRTFQHRCAYTYLHTYLHTTIAIGTYVHVCVWILPPLECVSVQSTENFPA